jgi:predicted DNA-binding transcriptional regulator AlpA
MIMNQLLTVKQVMAEYNLSRYVIYQSIKIDPSFPVINIGPKKNYRINRVRLEEWLYRRDKSREIAPFAIPTGDQLLKDIGK